MNSLGTMHLSVWYGSNLTIIFQCEDSVCGISITKTTNWFWNQNKVEAPLSWKIKRNWIFLLPSKLAMLVVFIIFGLSVEQQYTVDVVDSNAIFCLSGKIKAKDKNFWRMYEMEICWHIFSALFVKRHASLSFSLVRSQPGQNSMTQSKA